MSIFLDARVYVAFVNKKDKDHDRALVLKELASGKYGPGYTSDYVLYETLTVSLARTRRVDKAVNAGLLILGSKEDKIPALARLIKVDDGTIQAAWKSFRGGQDTVAEFHRSHLHRPGPDLRRRSHNELRRTLRRPPHKNTLAVRSYSSYSESLGAFISLPPETNTSHRVVPELLG